MKSQGYISIFIKIHKNVQNSLENRNIAPKIIPKYELELKSVRSSHLIGLGGGSTKMGFGRV
jgi:hypothetical protein